MRVLDGANQQIPYLVERRNEPLSIDLPLVQAPDVRAPELKAPPGSRQRSVYIVTLPVREPAAVDARRRDVGRACFSARSGSASIGPPDRIAATPCFEVRASQTWRHADEQTPLRGRSRCRIETMPETEIAAGRR